MPCELLDIKCIFLNELIGNLALAMIFVALLYFIMASKLKFDFETTIAFSIPLLLLGGIAITGFSAIYAFVTVIVGVMLAWVFQRMIKN